MQSEDTKIFGQAIWPWLISSKSAPINQQVSLVVRQALTSLQSDCTAKTLTLLEAPAGYGKSTLLAQWRDKLMAQDHVVGWLCLDEDDNSPATLITYIMYALLRGGMPISGEGEPILAQLAQLPVKNALGILLNTIAEAGGHVILILDDFESLDEPIVSAVVLPLIRLAPSNFHILIASRRRPELALSQLRAQGRLQEIRAANLRFTHNEIDELFGGKLSKAEINNVAEITQGWPVLLQLVHSWATQGQVSLHRLPVLAGFTGEIVDYLSEQVVRGFPAPVQTLLMETAILYQLSEADVMAICGSSADWQLLQSCEALKPFLVPLEGEENIYRLHPILKEFLLLELTLKFLERKQTLHRAAAQYYAATGRLLYAVRQAADSGDLELEARIIEAAGGVQLWVRHGTGITKSVNLLLIDQLLEQYPRLALLRALVLLKEGKLIEARILFDRVKAETKGFSRDREGGDGKALGLDGLIVESTLLFNECRVPSDPYLANYDQAMSEMSHGSDFFAGHLKNLLCLAYHQRGQFEKAKKYANEAMRHYHLEQAWHGLIFVHLHVGLIAFAEGRPTTAEAAYREALVVTQRYFESDRSKTLIISPLMAELKYECNELSSTRQHVANAVGRLQTSEAWLDVYVAACLTAASIAFIDHGVSGAVGIIDQAMQDASVRGLSGLDNLLIAAKATFEARAGLLDRATETMALLQRPVASYIAEGDDTMTWREREAVLLAWASLALRQNRGGDIAGDLARVTSNLLSTGHMRAFIRLAPLAARALWDAGEQAAAFDLMGRVCALVKETGYSRIFYDESDVVREVLSAYVTHHRPLKDEVVGFAQMLLGFLSESEKPAPISRLSLRELDVLRQLKEGYQDKIIARVLDITENTVKYHLKSIYSKLNVASRTEAVREAQRQSILD
jgi:LuxR family maltose regulon positive regulatory protein